MHECMHLFICRGRVVGKLKRITSNPPLVLKFIVEALLCKLVQTNSHLLFNIIHTKFFFRQSGFLFSSVYSYIFQSSKILAYLAKFFSSTTTGLAWY